MHSVILQKTAQPWKSQISVMPLPPSPTIHQISPKFIAQFRNPIHKQYLPSYMSLIQRKHKNLTPVFQTPRDASWRNWVANLVLSLDGNLQCWQQTEGLKTQNVMCKAWLRHTNNTNMCSYPQCPYFLMNESMETQGILLMHIVMECLRK